MAQAEAPLLICIDIHVLVAIRMVDSSSIIHTMSMDWGMKLSKLRDVDPSLKEVFCMMFDFCVKQLKATGKIAHTTMVTGKHC